MSLRIEAMHLGEHILDASTQLGIELNTFSRMGGPVVKAAIGDIDRKHLLETHGLSAQL